MFEFVMLLSLIYAATYPLLRQWLRSSSTHGKRPSSAPTGLNTRTTPLNRRNLMEGKTQVRRRDLCYSVVRDPAG